MNHWIRLGVMGLLLMLVVACGSDLVADIPTLEPEKSDLDIIIEEEVSSVVEELEITAVAPPAEAPKPTVEIVAEEFETDAKGVRVGFTADGHPYRGDPEAPIVIEEFSDFQCPFCARFSAQTLPGLEEEHINTGNVLLIYYDFPLNNIHPQAASAANAARCAGEQSAAAYWSMHDLLFANMQTWGGRNATAVFQQYGQDLGLDMESFTECVTSEKYADDIQADLDLGISRGVRSTPSFFVNNQPLVGAQPYTVFAQAIATIQEGGELPVAAAPPTPAPWVPPTPAAIVYDDIAATLGNPDAEVTIVEYTDYQCPFCGRHSAQTLPQIVTELIASGRVHYMLKDFPLDQIHPEARQASVAARCAGEHDLYWEMHDLLFEQQGEWSGQGAAANGVFVNLAVSLGLDADDFLLCLTDGRYDDLVEANFREGAGLGVRGTPAFFINGYPINGAQPFDLFEYAVGLAESGELAEAYRPDEQQQQQQQQQQQAQQPPSGPVEVPLGDSFILGDADAPIEIVEYTDFQCPFCRRHFTQTFPQIQANYIETGKVRYIFKDFPLTSIHPQAVLAAEAARCANDQGAYLSMHNMLFGQQQGWNGRSDAQDLFIGYADQLGLDTELFSTCLTTHVHEEAVNAEIQEAIGLGMRGTPAFFINGNFVNGAQPYTVFEEIIEGMLADDDT
ncbi:MAG: thioredoxin domain-containing protein [Chloroflexota bacterium]